MHIPSFKLISQSTLKKSPENSDGRTDGQTDGHCHSIIRPFFKRAYKNWVGLAGFPRVLISGKSPYFQLLPSRPWKSPYFWIFSIEVREKSWFSIAVTKPRWSTSSCASWGFSKCCGNDVELFGNPSDPLTNHRWRMVWRHLVPAKIPRASFIKFYYVVTESQSADTWCHVVVVRNLIGPHSRRYTWRTLCKTSSIFVEIRQHT